MTTTTATPSFPQTNLQNESEAYLARREELRLAEIDLMRQREKVAEMRRHLPPGAVVQDYVFQEGPANLDAGDTPIRDVRLSHLFTGPNRSLVVYHLMYGKKQARPCPMCTMLIDGWSSIDHHLAQNVDVVIVAAAPPADLRSHARNRGWNRLRLLSCGDNTFKRDLRSEDDEGRQDSTVSVIAKDPDGTLRHTYTAHPAMSPEIRQRGLDLLFPVYNILDLTPQGRGDWYGALDYPPR